MPVVNREEKKKAPKIERKGKIAAERATLEKQGKTREKWRDSTLEIERETQTRLPEKNPLTLNGIPRKFDAWTPRIHPLKTPRNPPELSPTLCP
jgi:hypothetical protein